MNYKDFIEEFNNADNESAFLESHIITEYVPYEKKITICNNVIKNTFYDENNNIKINSPASFMFYSLSLINEYTDIDVDFAIGLEIFNELNKLDLIDKITGSIPNNEQLEFSAIMDMMESDFQKNECGIIGWLNSKTESITSLVGLLLSDDELMSKLIGTDKNINLSV